MTAAYVDAAIAIREALGVRRAERFMHAYNVPHAVITRVLGQDATVRRRERPLFDFHTYVTRRNE